MLVVLHYFSGDRSQAVELFKWLKELGGCKNHSLLALRDSSAEPITGMDEIFGKVYPEIFIAEDIWKLWPMSPNHAFKLAARHIQFNQKEPWLWLEPDAVPLKEEWLDAIENEYKQCKMPIMGDKVDVPNVVLHCSGVAVYPAMLVDVAGEVFFSHEIAWDCYAASQIVPRTHFTELIAHSWKHEPFKDWEQVEREVIQPHPQAVLYHASKDGSLIRLLREQKKPAYIEACYEWSEKDRAIDREFYSLGKPTFDLFTKSYSADYPWLEYAARSIDKFASGIRQWIIVYPKGEEKPNIASKIPIKWVEIEEVGEGYLFQQIPKSMAHDYTDAEFIIHSDSDVIYTQPFDPSRFFLNEKPWWIITPYDKIEVPWKPMTEKFVGESLEYEFMRQMPMMVARKVHEATAKFCEEKHRITLPTYILGQPHRSFSEFNALGVVAYKQFHDEISWVDSHAQPDLLPQPISIQFFSHGGITDEIRAKIEAILGGTVKQAEKITIPHNQPASVPPNLSTKDKRIAALVKARAAKAAKKKPWKALEPHVEEYRAQPVSSSNNHTENQGFSLKTQALGSDELQARLASETPLPPPWKDREASRKEIKTACAVLKLFCSAPIYTRYVRDELKKAGVTK